MPTYRTTEGDEFVVLHAPRAFGGSPAEAFVVDQDTGEVQAPKGLRVTGTLTAPAVVDLSAATTVTAPVASGFVKKLSFAVTEASFAGLGDTDTSEVLALGTLPANSRILGVNVKLATAFTGGGNGAVTVDIGTTGDADAIVDGAVLNAAAVDGQASSVPAGIAPFKHFAAATVLNGTFVTDVGLKELTAGSATIEVLYTVLA